MHNLNAWKASVFESLDWCEIAVFQRNTEQQQLDLMIEAKKRGKFVVVEGDDDYINIPDRNSGKAYYAPKRPILEEMFRQAHAVSVTTKPLREVYLAYNKNISVIPNAYDLDIYDVTLPIQQVYIFQGYPQRPVSIEQFQNIREGKKFVCWAGSPTHEEDMELVIKPLERLIKKENVIVGMCAFVHKYMLTKYPENNLFTFGVVPNIAWYGMLQFLKPDVWLAPVVENQFNKSKSNLKKIEAAMMGSVFVGSDFDTYNQDELEGYLPNNHVNDDWYSCMRHAVNEAPEERERMNLHNRKVLEDQFDAKVTALQWEKFFKTGVGI
jgi:glycosyltransferase involved in cell wall biosynthesis